MYTMNMFKRWYLILTVIWVVFWLIINHILLPTDPIAEFKEMFTDPLMFQIFWLWTTAPILLYLIVVGLIKLYRWSRI